MSVPQRTIHVTLMLFVITRQALITVPVIVGIQGMDKRASVNIECYMYTCTLLHLPQIDLYSQR